MPSTNYQEDKSCIIEEREVYKMELFIDILKEAYLHIHSVYPGYCLKFVEKRTESGVRLMPDATTKENITVYCYELAPRSNLPFDIQPSLKIECIEKDGEVYVYFAKIFYRPIEVYPQEKLALFSNGALTLYPLRKNEREVVLDNEKDCVSKIAEHIIKAFKTMVDEWIKNSSLVMPLPTPVSAQQ